MSAPKEAEKADAMAMFCALRFDPTGLEKALAQGASPNARTLPGNPTALMRASENGGTGAIACVRLLLAAGADPNLSDVRGDTAAMWAAAQGNREGIELLAAAGADLCAKDLALWGVEQFAAGSLDASFIAWVGGYVQAWREARELAAASLPAKPNPSPRL